jgi:uncharacterized protein
MKDIEGMIKALQLEKHCEGGYYRRTYCSTLPCKSSSGKPRNTMSSIYYLVTSESKFSSLAVNQSDLILYHHQGDPMKIIFFDPGSQEIYSCVLGPDVEKGQTPQVVCPGGIWKAYDLMGGQYCLASEAVSPSFECEDMKLITTKDLDVVSPALRTTLAEYIP